MEELTEYEKQRAARLAENQAMLESLGLEQVAHEFEQVVSREEQLSKARAKEAEERLRVASLVGVSAGVRRSSRLRRTCGSSLGDLAEESEQVAGLKREEDFVESSEKSARSLKGQGERHFRKSDIAVDEGTKQKGLEGSDGECDDKEGDASEDDYRPDLDELSQEEVESEPEAAGDSDEDGAACESGPPAKVRSRKQRRKNDAAQSATKVSRSSKKQRLDHEGVPPDMDEDEINLQLALEMSREAFETAPPAEAMPNEASPSASKGVKTQGDARKAHPKPPDPAPDFFPSTEDQHNEIRALHSSQQGVLRALQRKLFFGGGVGQSGEAGLMGAKSPADQERWEGGGGASGQSGGGSGVGFEGRLGDNQLGGAAQASESEGTGKKGRKQKIKKPVAQPPTLDEIDALFHFFDDRGRGQLSLADLRHVAEAHDFTWSDEQLGDMIGLFDANHDGLLEQEDFRYLVQHCRVVLG